MKNATMRSVLSVATLALSLGIMLGTSAQAASLSSLFEAQDYYKAPFGKNMVQGNAGRVLVTVSESAPGGNLFASAYRSDSAQQLARQHDFYLGNLFTTNYYELMGEYVYGDPDSDHPLNHQALVGAAAQAMPKAASMVRHWILERHYNHQHPNGRMARSFLKRGVSGAEYEVPFAKYFINFFVTGLQDDLQFLTISLLAKGSAISESTGLDKARTMISEAYGSDKQPVDGDERASRLYELRNAIHNQVSYSTISLLDRFTGDYPGYKSNTLGEVRDILVRYYSVTASRVAAVAKDINATEILAAAKSIEDSGFTSDSALALSIAVADLRTALPTSAIPWDKKTDNLLVVTKASQFLNKEMNGKAKISSKNDVKILLNLFYIEGLLIQDNWQYFLSEVDAAPDLQTAISQLPDVIGIATDTLIEAFSPALAQWISVDEKMQYFVDNTIKSSAVNTASILVDKN